MDFKDYYKTLGLGREATQDDVRVAYRKLARKFHPDVSKEADAEARFKEINEANEVLKDPERRAAFDAAAVQWERQQAAGGAPAGQGFQPPPGWDAGFEFSGRGDGDGDVDAFSGAGRSDFFESLFGRRAGAAPRAGADFQARGQDHHAKVLIDLEDAYRGANRSFVLHIPETDASGRPTLRDRTLEVAVPKGVREGQHLRLAGQGGAGTGSAPAGDLYLEIAFNPHTRFRVEGRDVYVDLPVAPWEAALGGGVPAPTPEGRIELTIPAGSASGRKLRLKGRGIPGREPGDLYIVLTVVLPPADTAEARAAYVRFRDAVPFDPRRAS